MMVTPATMVVSGGIGGDGRVVAMTEIVVEKMVKVVVVTVVMVTMVVWW